ncbi:MAG: hypothetical protein ACR2LN_01740 [Candidatus Levyibacteriota bacterium]
MKSIQNRHFILTIFAFFLFVLAGVIITYPLISHMGEYITGYGDELNYAWIYNWAIHSLLSGNILNLYDTNIFYPYHIGLADSDPNLVTSFLAIIPLLLIKQPIVVVNFTVFSSIILVGFSLYLLAYYLTKNFYAAMLAGIIVIFSPAFLSFYVHIQMIAVEFVPLSLLFFLHFFKTKKTKFLFISLIFFLLQTYNNFIAGYFILFSYVIILAFAWFKDHKQVLVLMEKKNIILFIFSIVLLIPIMYPYYAVSKEFHYVRDIRDTIHFALQPEDYFYSSSFTKLQPLLNSLPFNRISQNNEFKPGFPGVVFFLLGIFVFIFGWQKRNKITYFSSFLTIAITGLILSLGPFLHLGRVTIHKPFPIPLPYAAFYYLLPGFQGFRNSARWEMLFLLAMAILIALFLHYFLKKYSLWKQTIVYCFLIVSCISEYNFPMRFFTVPAVKNFPAVEQWLTTTPMEATIIEVPLYNWNMFPYANIEFWRMYYSTIHFRRTVNGGGGFTPPAWQKMAYSLDATFPSEESLKIIKHMKVKYIIVHAKEFDQLHVDKYKINHKILPSGKELINELLKDKSIHLIKRFNNDYVFQIT